MLWVNKLFFHVRIFEILASLFLIMTLNVDVIFIYMQNLWRKVLLMLYGEYLFKPSQWHEFRATILAFKVHIVSASFNI